VFKPSDPWSSIRWLPFKNVGGAEAPPFALLRVTGVGADGVPTVSKPDADGKADLVNGPTTVADQQQGQATADSPLTVVYDSASGTPAAGDEWGPAAGSWLLTGGKKGWKVYGGATPQDAPAGTGLVLAGRLGGPGCNNTAFCTPTLAGYVCVDNGDGTFTANLTWKYLRWDGNCLTLNDTPCP
jgi:hypothetical protein